MRGGTRSLCAVGARPSFCSAGGFRGGVSAGFDARRLHFPANQPLSGLGGEMRVSGENRAGRPPRL
jgi:hypothetical protein